MTGRKTKTQEKQILKALQSGKRLTPLAALEQFGCMRLGARIWNLKNKKGWPIKTTIIKTNTGKHVAEYQMAKARQGELF